MNKPVAPTAARIRVIRNLTSTAFYATIHILKTDNSFHEDAELITPSVNESFHRIKTRLESFRVFSQAIPNGESNPASLALLLSAISKITTAHESLTTEKIKNEISQKTEEISDLTSGINELSAIEIVDTKSEICKNSARLWGALRKYLSPVAALSVCLSVAEKYSSGLQLNANDGVANIVREISFPPEYQQAGVSVLSYFSEVIKDRYPDIQVSVSIKQHGNSVTMIVTLPDGSKDEVNKVLEQYGLVITGKANPREVTSSDFRALALQQKLELAQLEIKQTKDLMYMQEKYSGQTIKSLQSDVAMLKELLGRELNAKNDLQVKLFELTNKLTDNQASNQVILLMKALAESFNADDEDKARVTLEDIRSAEPDFFERIHAFVLQAAAGGVIGNNATEWLKAVFSSLPK